MTESKSEIMPQTENAPYVSVIMSVYNGENFINRAVLSITNQTFKDFEFLIMNDGSSDKSLEKLEEWAKKDSRIKCFSQQNQGLNCALNYLIKNTRGKYIARMDADDFSFPTRLQEQVDYLERNETCDLVSSGVAYMDEYGQVFSAILRPDCPEYYEKEILSIRSNPVCHGAVMIRRNAMAQFMPLAYRTRYGQDFDLWFRMLASGYKFGSVQSVLYAYQSGSELQMDYEKNVRREMQKTTITRMYREGNLFKDAYCLSEFEAIMTSPYSDSGRKKFKSENMAVYLKRMTARKGCLGILKIILKYRHLLRGGDIIRAAVYTIVALFPVKMFNLVHDLVIYNRNRRAQSQWLTSSELVQLEKIIAE